MASAPSRSVSVVALLADIPSTGLLGENQAQRFTLAGGDLAERSTPFLDFAQHHVEQGRKVIALYPSWHAQRAQRTIAFARGALRTDDIAPIGMDIAPLAISLLADQLAYLAPYVPAGVTATLTSDLQGHILSGGWLPRVSNLSTIPIAFGQHVGSYIPGTTYMAFCAPVKRVSRVKKGTTTSIPDRPAEPIQVLVARPERTDIERFNQQFTPVVRAVSLSALPEQPLGPNYWGSRKYVEFVAFSAHPEALTKAVRTVRPTACSWCRELVTGLRCPFCRFHNQPSAGRPPSRSRDVPPPPTKSTGDHIRPAWVSRVPQDHGVGGKTGPAAQQPAAHDPERVQIPVSRPSDPTEH